MIDPKSDWSAPELDWDGADDERYTDPKLPEAKAAVLELFDNPETLLYQQQIEVLLERQFFHWITVNALSELVSEGKLASSQMVLSPTSEILFYRKPGYRYWMRHAKRMISAVREFTEGGLATSIGPYGELAVDAALGSVGFQISARNLREWQGRLWTISDHNLDRVYERDGVTYGSEIKNTLKYIPKGEFEIKLQMCRHLQLRPLFIGRRMPKNYMNQIWRAGGFGLIFEEQLYPVGFEESAERVRRELRLPVRCHARLPDGHAQRFLNWHVRNLARNQGGYS